MIYEDGAAVLLETDWTRWTPPRAGNAHLDIVADRDTRAILCRDRAACSQSAGLQARAGAGRHRTARATARTCSYLKRFIVYLDCCTVKGRAAASWVTR